jgi:hypothetical protein
MPYKIRKVNKRRCYSVKNLKKKKTFSKCTTRKNAQKQIRLLRALQFNKNFKPNERRRTSKGGTKPNKNKTVKIKMDKKTIAEEKKQEIEKTRPLHFQEYEDWYETIAEEELNSQLPYMRYLENYNE